MECIAICVIAYLARVGNPLLLILFSTLCQWVSLGVQGGSGELWSWRAINRTLLFQDQEFRLKGVNWFGYETDCYVVQGLWVRGIDEFFEFLTDNRYNAIRIPFSYELVGLLDQPVAETCVAANPWMIGMPIRGSLHMFFQKCMERGIAILLDFHTIGGVITTRPWTDDVSIENIIDAWSTMLQEYGKYPNLIGIDLKNEPHQISWHTWGTFVRQLVKTLRARPPPYSTPFRGLYFVEGIQDHSVWGGSFESMDEASRVFFLSNNDTVFSPHVYGVSVRGVSATHDTWSTFRQWFGFLVENYTNPIILGEIGGFFITDDYDWQMKIQTYLVSIGVRDIFYWCLNPDSIDTQGLLLEDWITPNEGKLAWHTALRPDPTVIDFRPFAPPQ